MYTNNYIVNCENGSQLHVIEVWFGKTLLSYHEHVIGESECYSE